MRPNLEEDGRELEDAAAVHRRHPDTFAIPSKKERAGLLPGDVERVHEADDRLTSAFTRLATAFMKHTNPLVSHFGDRPPGVGAPRPDTARRAAHAPG